jgi:dUTPase
MFKKLNENAIIPKSKNEYAAGIDVFASEEITIKPGYTEYIPIGIALDLDIEKFKGYFFGLYLTDTIAKKGVILPNGVGVINIDSTQEIRLLAFKPLQDPSGYENRNIHIKKGEKVGQLILQKFYK